MTSTDSAPASAQGAGAAPGTVFRSELNPVDFLHRAAYLYPDGPAPYYSIYAPGRPGQELEQWDEIKLAASEAIAALGGTITHHHAVGRDHRPWYLREVPQLFADVLRVAKAELDPAGIMNPGVLLPPPLPRESSRRGSGAPRQAR